MINKLGIAILLICVAAGCGNVPSDDPDDTEAAQLVPNEDAERSAAVADLYDCFTPFYGRYRCPDKYPFNGDCYVKRNEPYSPYGKIVPFSLSVGGTVYKVCKMP